jgi:hypothetical protein
MVGAKIKIAILGVLALVGIAVSIPTSLTSLVLTVAAVIGIVVVVITSVLR